MELEQQGCFRTAEEAIAWVTNLVRFGPKPGLARMEWMLERLGNPERRLKFIHVAGTNGKGSVCAYLTKVLTEAGYDVGTFNSPYLVRYTDRIQVNGNDIGAEPLLAIMNQIKPLCEELEQSELGHPTMFEVTTILAIVFFARHAYPDFVVWETGLGGRLDSTNIVVPIVSVITNIGYDHMEVLGETLPQIAAEKAGIIKAGVPVVTTAEQPEVLEVLERVAAEKKSRLYVINRDFYVAVESSTLNEQRFAFDGPFRALPDLTISMNGRHQVTNAAAALMTLEVLRQYYAVILEDEPLYSAMRAASWLGRLELVEAVERPGMRVLLDGAHNAEGAAALADALRSVYTYDKLHIMIGMLETKNHKDYVRHILPLADTLVFTEPDFRKKLDAAELYRLASELKTEQGAHAELRCEPDFRKALDMLLALAEPGALLAATGSLYLISDVRARLHNMTDTDKGW